MTCDACGGATAIIRSFPTCLICGLVHDQEINDRGYFRDRGRTCVRPLTQRQWSPKYSDHIATCLLVAEDFQLDRNFAEELYAYFLRVTKRYPDIKNKIGFIYTLFYVRTRGFIKPPRITDIVAAARKRHHKISNSRIFRDILDYKLKLPPKKPMSDYVSLSLDRLPYPDHEIIFRNASKLAKKYRYGQNPYILAAACIYIAFRMDGRRKTYNEIGGFLNIHATSISYAVRTVRDKLRGK
jgi:transcription initiation factor TFIIIB Brf1 subunit/transcription initiation factor TFIIB